mgnify:CR=1 FL=1
MKSLALQQTTPNTTTKGGVQMDASGGFTIIPHWVIDNLSMSPDHFLMFCIIARKTWGTSATSAAIPNPEMKGFLRCSLNHMLKVRDELESLGYIHVQKTNGGCNSKTIYSIAVNSSPSEPLSNGTVHAMNPNSSLCEPAILNKSLNKNTIPPISPQGGQDAQQVVEAIASEPTNQSETETPKVRKPRAKRGEITADTEQAMKELINSCECYAVPKGFLLSYLKYRHSVIKKPIKSTQGLQAQINVLAELTTEDAMKAAIKYTMDNEWIKIVVPDAVKTAMAKTKNAQHIDMPRFDLSDGGTKLQKWAVGQGFRAAKGGEDAWAYLEAVKTWVAEKNGGAV